MSKAPPRPSMSAARRVRIFQQHEGRCYLCEQKIQVTEMYDIDHVQAWALTFDDSDSNLRPVHKVCHRDLKTGPDVARIAKAKRQGGETGQQARRSKNGPTLKGRSDWPPKGKTKWPKRPMSRSKDANDS